MAEKDLEEGAQAPDQTWDPPNQKHELAWVYGLGITYLIIGFLVAGVLLKLGAPPVSAVLFGIAAIALSGRFSGGLVRIPGNPALSADSEDSQGGVLTMRSNTVPNWMKTAGLAILFTLAGMAILNFFVVPPCGRVFAAAECPVGSTSVFTQDVGIQAGSPYTMTFTTAGMVASSTVTFPTSTAVFLVGRDTTDTLTSKTLTSPVITTSPTAAGATWADLGTATTADINGGTVDGATIGGSSAAAGTFTAGVFTSISNTDGNVTNVGDIALDSLSPDATNIVINPTSGGVLVAVAGSHPTAPDSGTLHVWNGDAGNTTDGLAELTVEDDADAFIQILSSAAGDAGILFGDSGGTSQGVFTYNHGTDQFNWSVVGGSELSLTSTALQPVTTDGLALGTSGLNFADVFLDLGAVINFDSGDITVTHSANALAFAGATGSYTFDDLTVITNTGVLEQIVIAAQNLTADAVGVGSALLFQGDLDGSNMGRVNLIWEDSSGNTRMGLYTRDTGIETEWWRITSQGVLEAQSTAVIHADGGRSQFTLTGGTIQNPLAVRNLTAASDGVGVALSAFGNTGAQNMGRLEWVWQTSTTTNLRFKVRDNSVETEQWRIWADGGLTDGSLASQGAGTINAEAVYDNGVLLTDYVSDAYKGLLTAQRLAHYNQIVPDTVKKARRDVDTGEIIAAEAVIARDHEPAQLFADRGNWVFDPVQLGDYFLDNGHLPQLISEEDWVAGVRLSQGEYTQRLMELIEVLVLQNYDLAKRLAALEAAK